MSEMVRKLAWHAATAFTDRTDVDEDTVQHFIPTVRAVLQAMMEPTPAMCDAGANELFASVEQDWNEDAKRIWTAMLTAALGDPRHG